MQPHEVPEEYLRRGPGEKTEKEATLSSAAASGPSGEVDCKTEEGEGKKVKPSEKKAGKEPEVKVKEDESGKVQGLKLEEDKVSYFNS